MTICIQHKYNVLQFMDTFTQGSREVHANSTGAASTGLSAGDARS